MTGKYLQLPRHICNYRDDAIRGRHRDDALKTTSCHFAWFLHGEKRKEFCLHTNVSNKYEGLTTGTKVRCKHSRYTQWRSRGYCRPGPNIYGPLIGRKEGSVLFNDALNTFYLRLYGVRHMVKDHSDSEKGNPLPSHRPILSINNKGSFICTIPHTG